MKYFLFILFSIVTIFLIWINYPLVYRNTDTSETVMDVYKHLNFIENELKHNGLGDRMQETYPEGYVFINALYGLAWCELALADPRHSAVVRNKALSEALFAYNEVNSDRAKQPFDNSLYPECGIYYFGWKNYLISKILMLDTTFVGHEFLVSDYNFGCYALNQIINEKDSPYMQTYQGHTWPVDMFVAVASLKNYDRIFGAKYDADVVKWIDKVKTRLDTETGLVPHKVNSGTGLMTQSPRGSSMSLTLRMLAEIDTVFAAEQYGLLEKNFASSLLGLPYLREYPKGVDSTGDIDSGPVIFGIGFSGTVVMTGVYGILGNIDMYEKQFRTINTFGFSKESGNGKSYLLGKYPMGDAFVAWGAASGLKNCASRQNVSVFRFPMFSALSLSLIIILWLFYFRKKIFRHSFGNPH